jgi:hypothetical protein
MPAAEFLRTFLTKDKGDTSISGGGIVNTISNFFGWRGSDDDNVLASAAVSGERAAGFNPDMFLDPMDQAWNREIAAYHDCGKAAPPAQMSEPQKRAFRQAQTEEADVRAVITGSHMSDQNQRDLEKWFHGLSVYMYSTDRFRSAVPSAEPDKYGREIRAMPFLVDPKYYVSFNKRAKGSLFHHARMNNIASSMARNVHPLLRDWERSLIIVPNKSAVNGVYQTLVSLGVDEDRLYVAVMGEMDNFYTNVSNKRGLTKSKSKKNYNYADAIKRFNGGTKQKDYTQRIMIVTLDFAHCLTQPPPVAPVRHFSLCLR